MRASLTTPSGSAAAAPTHDNSVTPTVTAGPACGVTPPAPTLEQTNLTSTDTYGEIRFGTGASGNGTGQMVTLTFGTPFQTKPKVSWEFSNNGLTDRRINVPSSDITTTSVTFSCGASLAASVAGAGYKLIYKIEGV